MKICALFPGQGFQRFGMLAPLAQRWPQVVKPVLSMCDEALPDLDLPRLLLGQGTPVDPKPTELAQPMLLAQGYAHFLAWQLANRESGTVCTYGMGHSLGEFTALVAAGILDFPTGLKLVRARGEAMRDATKNTDEKLGMVTVIRPRTFKGDWLALLQQCSERSQIDIAAYNAPSQTVVSGPESKLAEFNEIVKCESNSSKLITKALPVSSAFHSRYMQPASDRLRELVSAATKGKFSSRKFDVVANLTGRPYASIAEIEHNLVASLTHPVAWLQSYEYVDGLVDEYVAMGGEIGKLMEKETKVATSNF